MKQLESFLQNKIKLTEISSTKYLVSLPMYKIDGGEYKIYLVSDDGKFFLSDEGTTTEELDKVFELGEPDVIKNLLAVMKQYGCIKDGKKMLIECTPKDIHIKLSYLVQAMSFMLNMKIFYV